MCEICRSNPCDPMCPNSDAEPAIIGICEQCKSEINAANIYAVDDEDNMFCNEECAKKYHGIKEREYYYD